MKDNFRWRAKDSEDKEPQLAAGIRTGLVRYTLQQLEIATNDFSSDNEIGEGRFGSVFRGEIDYRAVTVERLDARYHPISDTLFIKEINALGRIHHRNITSLIGFCISKDERLLVFDFAENNSLKYHLHDSACAEKGEVLDWRTRRKIALGTARALAYLHHDCEPRIIHGDIKPANILLNSEFEAKVSGYGFSQFYPDSGYEFTTTIVARLGPVDPYYSSSVADMSVRITPWEDVFSFGNLLLNLITGKGSCHGSSKLVIALKGNKFDDIVDPHLPRDYDPKEISCMVACAVVSTFPEFSRHQQDMDQIINVLEGGQMYSFIRQVLGISPYSYPAPPLSFRVSPPPKKFIYPSLDEDTEDMESLTLSSDINPPASSSYIHPLPSSSKGDLVTIGEDMNSPASSSYINPLPSSSVGDLVAIGQAMNSLPLSPDMNPPAASSYINPLQSSSVGDLVAIGEDMNSLPLPSDMNPPALSSEEDIVIGFVKYTLSQLQTATNNFLKHNNIGKGAFATVYKGNLENGPVAIKKLIAEGERRDEDFKSEINAISRVSHSNIISLVGYCIDGSARLLVYELAPNGSLADHLGPDVAERRSTLDWETRKKIMLGTAKALEYLHDNCKPRMVHRDIKAENVLLSSKFEAKLADLGIAKLQPTSFASHLLSTKVKGTPGYLDPYYWESGIVTHKSDVYSFGILLLVSVTGFKPSEELEEAKGKLKSSLRNKNFNDLADKCLNNVYDRDDMQRMIACAAVSTLPSPHDRPTMEEVVEVMRGVISPNGFIKKYLRKKNHK